jgi:hypothetical protein
MQGAATSRCGSSERSGNAADGSPPPQSAYGNNVEGALGLAAQAAFIHGDRFRAVSLLRDAAGWENDLTTVAASIFWLRERADSEMKEMMIKAKVWEIL